MQIINIKTMKDGRIMIKCLLPNTGEDKPNEVGIKCVDKPAEAFTEAIAALKPHVCTLDELPDEWVSKITILGVEYFYAGENLTLGCEIEYERALVNYITGQKAKTKKRYVEKDTKMEDYQVLSEDQVTVIKLIISEAEKYLVGLRLEIDLFSNPPDKEGETTE